MALFIALGDGCGAALASEGQLKGQLIWQLMGANRKGEKAV